MIRIKLLSTLFVIILFMFFTSCGRYTPKTVEDVEDTSTSTNTIINQNPSDQANEYNDANFIGDFIKAIQDEDKDAFTKLINRDELIVVRSFSSGNGTRGKDIILNVKPDSITSDLSFPVEDETPIELNFLFKDLIEKGENELSTEDLSNQNFDMDQITSTEYIWNQCSNILEKMDNTEWGLHLIKLQDNQFALFEGGNVDDFPLGGWLIFEKNNDGYYIEGIFDLR